MDEVARRRAIRCGRSLAGHDWMKKKDGSQACTKCGLVVGGKNASNV